MKDKHVTIDASAPGTPNKRSSTERNFYSHDAIPDKTMNTPRYMLSPGEDGYRTPTYEDYELQNTPRRAQQNGGFSDKSSHPRLPHTPHTPPPFFGRASANPSSTSLAHSILGKLQWRERIRHFTWTFFALTMAVSHISIGLSLVLQSCWTVHHDAGILVP